MITNEIINALEQELKNLGVKVKTGYLSQRNFILRVEISSMVPYDIEFGYYCASLFRDNQLVRQFRLTRREDDGGDVPRTKEKVAKEIADFLHSELLNYAASLGDLGDEIKHS